jgi:hypothetical protein
LLSRGLVERLHLRSRRYAIETEMLIKAAQVGARFAYVPVRTIYGEQGSHFRPVPDTFQIACAAIYYKVFDDPRPPGERRRKVMEDARVAPALTRLVGSFDCALTVDVEEWYHTCWVREYVDPARRPPLVEELDRLLPELLELFAEVRRARDVLRARRGWRAGCPRRIREVWSAGARDRQPR